MAVSAARAGDAGALIELGDVSFDELQTAVRVAKASPGVEAAIAGHSSILVLHDVTFDAPDLIGRIKAALEATIQARPTGRTRALRVSVSERDAPDLARLLAGTGMSRANFVAELASLRLRARYLGFRPGFAYLEGLPPGWAMPRLSTPRAAVPSGSLGVAGAMAGFYAEVSPGGWNLIGRTDSRLWDPWAAQPNLIASGDVVHILPTDETLESPDTLLKPHMPDSGLDLAELVAGGQLTLLVRAADRTRCSVGLPEGGPFDPEAAAAANAAVGNRPDAVLLECVAVGPTLRFVSDCLVSWVGASADIRVNGRHVEVAQQIVMGSEDTLSVGPLHEGFRGYLSIHPEPVDDGAPFEARPTVVVSGSRVRGRNGKTQSPRIRTLARSSRLVIRGLAGPHRVEEMDLRRIESTPWTVSTLLDRVGIRLRANQECRVDAPADLPSCGMQFGTVQWHPDGNLVVLGPDHPITGGYLQPFTVPRDERWKLAWLRPGESVRWMIER